MLLHPEFPVPNMTPQGHFIIILDLKDGFFSIPLCPDDKEHFIFSIPTLSNQQ